MKRIKIIILFGSVLLLACCLYLWNRKAQSKPEKANIAATEENPYRDAEIKAVVIPSADDTFGYDIYLYGSVLVHQPARPGLSGNAGFATEEDAMKVAELVIKKIRNNEMPPTVTMEELRALGLL